MDVSFRAAAGLIVAASCLLPCFSKPDADPCSDFLSALSGWAPHRLSAHACAFVPINTHSLANRESRMPTPLQSVQLPLVLSAPLTPSYLSPAKTCAEMPNQAIGAFPGVVSRTQRQREAPGGRPLAAHPYVPTTELFSQSLASTGRWARASGGIVTWRGGSQSGPDDALLPTLPPGFYFCFSFSYF